MSDIKKGLIIQRLSWILQATNDIEKIYRTAFTNNEDFAEIRECVSEIEEELGFL